MVQYISFTKHFVTNNVKQFQVFSNNNKCTEQYNKNDETS